MLKAFDEGLADFHAVEASCTAAGCDTRFFEPSLGAAITDARDIGKNDHCVTAQLVNDLYGLSTDQFTAIGDHYVLGTVLATALYKAGEANGGSYRQGLQRAVLAAYSDPSTANPGLAQLIEANANTPEQFTITAALNAIVKHVPDDGMQDAVCQQFFDRFGLTQRERPARLPSRVGVAHLPGLPVGTKTAMNPARPLAALLCLSLALPAVALAQDAEEAIPYSDDPVDEPARAEPPPPRELPKRSEPKPAASSSRRGKRAREQAEHETRSDDFRAHDDEAEALPYGDESDAPLEAQEKAPPSYSGLDDPNTGVALQLFGGLMLLDSSRGALADSHLAWGARFTWEFGRALFSELGLRDALFADVSYSYVGFRDGTAQVFGDSNLHYFALAPAWTWFFDEAHAFGLYVQGGGGVAYQSSSFHVSGTETPTSGVAPLFQYGLGLRGRPLLGEGSPVRLTFRIEATRYRRGYQNDTFLGASLGGGF